MNNRNILLMALVLVLGFSFGAFLFSSNSGGVCNTTTSTTLSCPVCLECPGYNYSRQYPPCPLYTSELVAVYLYPQRCIDCRNDYPTSCTEDCVIYNDTSMIESLSRELNVSISYAVADVVRDPSLFVSYRGVGGLGDARSRYNMISTLCAIAKNKKACDLLDEKLGGMRECLAGYGINKSTVIYHYTETGCSHCNVTSLRVNELVELSYNDSINYSVAWFEGFNDTQMNVLDECISEFIDLNYVPQLFCPANGRSITGEIQMLSQVRNFADECIAYSLRK